MHIIIGLGNPDSKYQATRHNIGWDAITRISDDYRIPLNFKRHKAICGIGFIEGEKVILAQPATYMNLSGESVRELVDFYKVSPEDIIVIYDDTSLDVGQLRIRKKGSAGGHNGIKSIISHLGTQEFPRIKIGIGTKPEDWDLADYVLSRFRDEEQAEIRQALKNTSNACKIIITDDIDVAMNIYNKKKETREKVQENKTEENKAGVEKAGTNKAEVEKAEENKAEVEKAEENKAEVEKAEENKAGTDKTGVEKAEENKAGTDKTGVEKAEVKKAEKSKAETNKAGVEKAEENKAVTNKAGTNKAEGDMPAGTEC